MIAFRINLPFLLYGATLINNTLSVYYTKPISIIFTINGRSQTRENRTCENLRMD